VLLFNHAEKDLAALKSQKGGQNASTYDCEDDLDEASSSLHRKLGRLSLKRFQPRNALQKAKWAISKGKNLNRLIQDI